MTYQPFQLIMNYRNHRLFGMALSMMSWRAAAMVLSLGNSIWVARHLGVYKLGVSGMITASIGQALLIVMLGMDALLIRKYKNAQTVAVVSIFEAAISYRFFTACAISLLMLPFVAWYGFGHPDWTLGLVVAFPLTICLSLTPMWLLSALELQPALYRSNFWGVLASFTCNILIVNEKSPAGTDLIAQFICGIVVLLLTCHAAGVRIVGSVSLRALRASWELVKEGKWLALMGIVIYVYISFEVPLLGYLTSIDVVGKYRTAVGITIAAQSILGIVPTILYPRCVEWRKRGVAYLWEKQNKIALLLAMLGIPASIISLLVLPGVFEKLYGPVFVAAAIPAAILITSKMVVLINGIYGAGLLAQAHDKDMMFLAGGAAVFSLSLNIFLIPHWGMLAAASVNLFSELFILAGGIILCRRYMMIEARRTIPDKNSIATECELGNERILIKSIPTSSVCALIVTRNRRQMLTRCLAQLRAQTRPPNGIIVVDNGSDDGTREWLDSQVDLTVVHQQNLGGAGGFYRGMHMSHDAGYDCVWCMDDDVVPAPQALEELMKARASLDDPDGWVLNSVVLLNDSGDRLTWGMFVRDARWREPVGRKYESYSEVYRDHPDGFFPNYGCFFNATLIPRSIMSAIGFPRREFFMKGDEIEYVLRVVRKFRLATVLSSVVTHPLIQGVVPAWRYYLGARNIEIINREYFPGFRNSRVGLVLRLSRRWGSLLFQDTPMNRMECLGMWDALWGYYGRDIHSIMNSSECVSGKRSG